MPTQNIPNGWKKVKLGEVVEFIDGDRGKNYPKKHEFLLEGYCLFLNTKNLPGEGWDFSETIFITKEKDKLLRKGKLQRGDYVFTTRGTVGNFAYFDENIYFENIRINSGMVILRPNTNLVYRNYLSYVFGNKYFQNDLKNFISGTAQPQLPINQMRNILILLPPLPIQQKIASILSKYDDLIENNNKRIKILEQMGKAIFDDMMKQAEEKGELEEVRVKEIMRKIPTGKKYSSKTVNKEGKVPVLDQGRSGIIGYHNNEPGVFASPDNPIITFANHTCYQNLIMFPFSTIQNVFAFLPIDGLDIYWLFYATKGLISFYDYKGHFPEFLEKKAFIPKNLDYSKNFGEIASKLHKEIYNLQLQNQNLKQTRDLLIPRLVSGKLDIEKIEVV